MKIKFEDRDILLAFSIFLFSLGIIFLLSITIINLSLNKLYQSSFDNPHSSFLFTMSLILFWGSCSMIWTWYEEK